MTVYCCAKEIEDMNISLKEGSRQLDMTIKGYECTVEELKTYYDDEKPDINDLNWLDIRFRYSDGKTVRECVDPCIQTWEYGNVIEGLEELLAGKVSQFTEEDIWLMEPVMRFVANAAENGNFSLKVGVWPEGKMGEDIDSVIIEQTVTAAELTSIIAKLRLGRKCFPARKGE